MLLMVKIFAIGAFMFSSVGIKTEQECGNCSRTLVGESCCKTIFENTTSSEGYVGLTPNFPAKIIPINLSTVGQKLIAKSGAYMCHIGQVSLAADLDCFSFASCCGGLGTFRQGITGTGTVFLNAGGVVLSKVLADTEMLVVDTDALVAFQDTVKVNVRPQSNLCVCWCGGEGCFNTTITGPGLVILESMSFMRYKAAVQPPQVSNDNAADGDANAGQGNA
jgi:uncharacterized protein (AIM24 family)